MSLLVGETEGGPYDMIDARKNPSDMLPEKPLQMPGDRLFWRSAGWAPTASNLLALEALIRCGRQTIVGPLPNDLSRLIYLASLRDCNTGSFLHPQLSRQNDPTLADQALSICHREVFDRLVVTPLRQYVDQLETYIRYTRADRSTVIKMWRSLKAYRAAVPVRTPPLSAALFFLNIESALSILEETLADAYSQTKTGFGESI